MQHWLFWIEPICIFNTKHSLSLFLSLSLSLYIYIYIYIFFLLLNPPLKMTLVEYMFCNHILSISFENNGRPCHLLASISATWWQLETCIVLIIPSWFCLFLIIKQNFIKIYSCKIHTSQKTSNSTTSPKKRLTTNSNMITKSNQ